jgi:site-specific recombinase XerD
MTGYEATNYQSRTSQHHASIEEYSSFVHEYTEYVSRRRDLLRAYERFIQCYPNLHDWFLAPLTERVGRINGEMKHSVCYEARTYLKFLALEGYAQFDWEWLIATRNLDLKNLIRHFELDFGLSQMMEEAAHLGYTHGNVHHMLMWVMSRLCLHAGVFHVDSVTDIHLSSFKEAVRRFGERPDVHLFFGSPENYYERFFQSNLYLFHMVLYQRGQIATEPHRATPRQVPRTILKPRMEAVIEHYLAERQLTNRPKTVEGMRFALRYFVSWIAQAHPEIETFAELNRDHILDFADALNTMIAMKSKRLLADNSKATILSYLSLFFEQVWRWQWDDAPERPLLQPGDVPKRPRHVPRYIPEVELGRLMPAIRELACPFQRAALLIARWSGARRDEILRLPLNCLDNYPDGTPRLHIPVGKTYKERLVPINEEAAEAIRLVQQARQGRRGYRDPHTGAITHYLFMKRGRVLSDRYLFDDALDKVCEDAGLLTPDDKRTISPHRFRHTLGTQLADRGARLHTIMKILGHDSVNMTIVYACISDAEVRKDYDALLGPGAAIAGPSAELLRSGKLSDADVHWLKTNFFKTELELGHCLRLPQEGPCECDLYLNCAKFVTTPEYAPRLRHRRKRELELIEDAISHGWQREVERHHCTVKRIEQLLLDLGEAIDGPEATG